MPKGRLPLIQAPYEWPCQFTTAKKRTGTNLRAMKLEKPKVLQRAIAGENPKTLKRAKMSENPKVVKRVKFS